MELQVADLLPEFSRLNSHQTPLISTDAENSVTSVLYPIQGGIYPSKIQGRS